MATGHLLAIFLAIFIFAPLRHCLMMAKMAKMAKTPKAPKMANS